MHFDVRQYAHSYSFCLEYTPTNDSSSNTHYPFALFCCACFDVTQYTHLAVIYCDLTFMTLKPKFAPRNWIVCKIYDILIWILIAVSYYALSFLIYTMFCVLQKYHKMGDKTYDLNKILQIMYRIFFRQRRYFAAVNKPQHNGQSGKH